jgi:hypothetical protein
MHETQGHDHTTTAKAGRRVLRGKKPRGPIPLRAREPGPQIWGVSADFFHAMSRHVTPIPIFFPSLDFLYSLSVDRASSLLSDNVSTAKIYHGVFKL